MAARNTDPETTAHAPSNIAMRTATSAPGRLPVRRSRRFTGTYPRAPPWRIFIASLMETGAPCVHLRPATLASN